MDNKTPAKLLTAETPFHAVAIALVVHAMITGGNIRDSVTNALLFSVLGRVTPTEILDKVLDIPIGGKRKE